jgi:uncharacterized protein (TIGR03000 family)
MSTGLLRLSLSGVTLLALTLPALAQHGRTAPAPAPAPHPPAPPPATVRTPSASPTPRDVLGAYGFNANVGLHSAAPLAPRSNFSSTGYSSNPTVQNIGALIGAPNNFFPSKTTSFSTAPLFPYSSPSFPYGFGLLAREPNDETQKKPIVPRYEYSVDPNSATMNVRVPADAVIWFEGSKTGQRGATRTFVSPPLERGQGFTYEIRARWTKDGKEVEQTRRVRVRAGEYVDVDFGAQ